MPHPMPKSSSEARSIVDVRMHAWALRWFVFGLVASLLVPALRGYNLYVGWLPFWLLAAPAILLALIHRVRLAAALSAFLVGRRRRRTPSTGRQARRRARPRRQRLPAAA